MPQSATRMFGSAGPTAGGAFRAVWLSNSLLQPTKGAEMKAILAKEDEARHLFAAKQRELGKISRSSSIAILNAERRAHAQALRAEYDMETGKDLRYTLRDVEPASDEEVVELATLLNVAMCRKWPQERGQSTYFKLFRHMDRDGSGLISYYELAKFARELLKSQLPDLSERRLKAFWRWVDDDCSGQISSGEFIRLMRQGWAGFLEEQERLRHSPVLDVLRRPNWVMTAAVKGGAWSEQTVSLAERRRHALASTCRDIEERTQTYREQARKLQIKNEAWLDKMERLAELEQQNERRAQEKPSRPNSRSAVGRSYSTPTLGHTGYRG